MQPLQPRLARDHRLGAALGLEGQVDVFKFGLGHGFCNRQGKRIGQLALFRDRPKDRATPRLKLAQITQPFLQFAQLGVVKAAGHLFAVARDEGDGRAAIQQVDRRRHLTRGRGNLNGDQAVDLGGVWGRAHANPRNAGRGTVSPTASGVKPVTPPVATAFRQHP